VKPALTADAAASLARTAAPRSQAVLIAVVTAGAASRLDSTVVGSGAVRSTPRAVDSAAVTSAVLVLESRTNHDVLAPPAESDAANALASFVATSDLAYPAAMTTIRLPAPPEAATRRSRTVVEGEPPASRSGPLPARVARLGNVRPAMGGAGTARPATIGWRAAMS
jgi:hypothetical protein